VGLLWSWPPWCLLATPRSGIWIEEVDSPSIQAIKPEIRGYHNLRKKDFLHKKDIAGDTPGDAAWTPLR